MNSSHTSSTNTSRVIGASPSVHGSGHASVKLQSVQKAKTYNYYQPAAEARPAAMTSHSQSKNASQARDHIAQRLAELNCDDIQTQNHHHHYYGNVNKQTKTTSPVKPSSPPKRKPYEDDEDDDGVRGFTLRLTQVQVSEEKKSSNLPRWQNP